MKILIAGDCVGRDTGFGNQTQLLVETFIEAGHEVVIAGAGAIDEDSDLKATQYNIPYHYVEPLDQIIVAEEPDVCILFTFIENIIDWSSSRYIGSHVPAFFWMAWEADQIRPRHKVFKDVPEDTVVHLTEFAKKHVWQHGDHVISHGVDSKLFKPCTHKKVSRKHFAREHGLSIDEDAIIIVNVDRNDYRKRWDLTYDYIRRLSEKYPKKVQLIAHTSAYEQNGYDQYELMKQFGVTHLVQLTNQYRNHNSNTLSAEDYAELMSLADFRISTSLGEGFGIPTIEAMASGTVNIIPDGTCYPEVGHGFTVPSRSRVWSMGILWDLPDVEGMVDKTIEYIQDKDSYDKAVEKGLYVVNEKYSKELIGKQWLDLLENLPKYGEKDFYYGYRTGLAIEEIAVVLNVFLHECGAGITNVFNFERLARELRRQGHRIDSHECRPEMWESAPKVCHCSENFESFIPNKVSIMLDCTRNLNENQMDGLINAVSSSEHVILRFEELDNGELVSVGPVISKLLDRGFVHNEEIVEKVTAGIKAQKNTEDTKRIQVWSKDASNSEQ